MGELQKEDWRLLLQHSHTSVDMVEFSAAIRLYFDKKSVAKYNYEKLKVLNNQYQGKHSGHGASPATSDEAVGLDAVVSRSKNAQILLTSNLWAEVGLCNGSFGVVDQFWYAEAAGPPSLLNTLFVHFPGYTGPGFISACEKCIPVPPKVFEWMVDGKYLSRQQIPLRLRYTMTIHESQGQTLPKVVDDLGKRENGCTFVATSMVRSIKVPIQPFQSQQFRKIHL